MIRKMGVTMRESMKWKSRRKTAKLHQRPNQMRDLASPHPMLGDYLELLESVGDLPDEDRVVEEEGMS